MEDIHGLKPLMGMDFPWLSLAIFGLILLIALSSIGVILWKLLKRKKPTEVKPLSIKVQPRKDYREQALKALKKLKPQASHPESFYITLEDILRTYLSAHYHLNISSYTRSELSQFFRDQADNQNLNTHHLNMLLQVLSHGEQAKFAKQNLTEALQTTDRQAIQDFVKSTPSS